MCFSHFLNCTNNTKSRNAPHIMLNFNLPIKYCGAPIILKARSHHSKLLSSNLRVEDSWLKIGIIFLDNFSVKNLKSWNLGQLSCLIISVKETLVTSAFGDDADRVECALNPSGSIPVIARTCPNHRNCRRRHRFLWLIHWHSPSPQALRFSRWESIALLTQNSLSLKKL